MRHLISLVLFSVSAGAFSQTVFNASEVVFQPTVKRDEGGYSSCGVRVMASMLDQNGREGDLYDFSVAIYADSGMALLKAGKYTVKKNTKNEWDISSRAVALPAPTSFWVAGRDQDGIAKAGKIMSADDKGFILGASSFREALEVIYAVASSKPIQFALRYPNERIENVISFTVAGNEDGRAAVFSCIEGFKARLEKEVKTK